jgi:hypothetical protein
MTGKEMVQSVSENTSRHDNQKTARNTRFDINSEIQPDGKNSFENQNLVEMDEEEISFHEQTTQNLVIETGLEGIESVKRNYNDTTLRQNALREIELKKPALMVCTDGSIIGEERGVIVYCEAKGFEGRYKIGKDVPISSAKLKAIEIGTNFIFRTKGCLRYSLTRERHAKY